MEHWKISDFAKMLKKHPNTVDGWFKKLEDMSLHSVGRLESGEKVYTLLDLEIAQFINQKRSESWALEAIFQELPNHFELRPLEKMGSTSVPQVTDQELLHKEFEEMKSILIQELVKEVAKEVAAAQADLIKALPQPKSVEDERQERITEMITRRRIESELEREALHMWSTKPESERMIKVGFFRKEEDRDKRERFVKNYIDEHFASRIKQEYGLD